jgi:MOSC domain-containing protein YiiM
MAGELGTGTVAAVCVSTEPRTLERRGRQVPTGIFKQPVARRIALEPDGVVGDHVMDRSVHGGSNKAVYAYAGEDVAWWEGELDRTLAPGTFGENLSTRGIDVSGALLGERWRIGDALLEVSEPRFPCWKIARKMGDPMFVKRFSRAARPGAYLRVIEPGEIGAGDAIEIVDRPGHDVDIRLMSHVVLNDHDGAAKLLEVPTLSDMWREWARSRLAV